MAWDLPAWMLAGMVGTTCVASLASGALHTVGVGGTYSNIGDAWAAAGANDTIQFVDSDDYSSGTLSLAGKTGLTIESAVGQRATINFADGSDGFLLLADNVTFRNLNLNTQDGTSGGTGSIISGGDHTTGLNATITNVSFVRTVQLGNYDVTALVDTAGGMQISYSTFRGSGASPIGLGVGITWVPGTTATLNHNSLDNFMIPISNPGDHGSSATGLNVTNSAFGAWHSASWAGAISLAADSENSVASEDYNAWYNGTGPFTYIPAGTVNSGGHTIGSNTFAGVFVGNLGEGDWEVNPSLYTAASDGTAIGAWQVIPEPSVFGLLSLGALATTLKRRR